MTSKLQEFVSELNKNDANEKKKFAEKVKNDNDLQSLFSQLSEIKEEEDKKKQREKEALEKKYAVSKMETATFNFGEALSQLSKNPELDLDQLLDITNSVQNPEPEPEPEPTLAEIPEDPARGERIELSNLSETVKEILPDLPEPVIPEEPIEPKSIIELTTQHIESTKLKEQKENDSDDKLEREFKKFKDLITQQLGSLGGGGAVNIKDLDDVDSTAFVDGKALVYQAATGKFIGGESGGGGTSAGVVSGEGSIDEIILDGTDASSTDAGDQITQEIGTEDYVLGKDGYLNDDGFEWVNDNNTSTSVDTPNTYVTLTNSRKASSLSQYLPKKHGSEDRVTRIWDDTNDKLYFNQLERKDWLIIRCGLKINPTVHNTRVVVRMLVTTKHGSSFPVEAPATILGPSGAGITYEPEFIITFYVGDLDGYETTDTYGEIQVQGDGPFTIEDFDLLTIKG